MIEHVGFGSEVSFDNEFATERTVIAAAIACYHWQAMRRIGWVARVGEMGDIADAVYGDTTNAHQARMFAVRLIVFERLDVGIDYVAPGGDKVGASGLLLPRENCAQRYAGERCARHGSEIREPLVTPNGCQEPPKNAKKLTYSVLPAVHKPPE